MRVAWVHPTWRDLVIERLAEDQDLRRHFLTHCGIHGLVLAISVGGGRGGERMLPLVGADEDWDAIGDRLYAVIPELEAQETVAVLAALRLAVVRLSETEAEDESAARREVESLAEMALARTRRDWDARGEPIPIGLLDAWLALARRLRPPPEPPALAVTWADLLPAIVPELTDVAEVGRLADWLTLCQMLDEFSPQVLLGLGFGPENEALIGRFLALVASGPDAARADHVIRALDAVGPNLINLRGPAQRLAAWLRAETTPDDPWPLQEWLAGDPGREPRPPVTGEAYDVARVLADL